MAAKRTGGDGRAGIEEGRPAQRRRTRRAIVAATMELLAAGGTPSVGEIAAAAEVSRRTVYSYFPTLDQLLVDASLGLLSAAEEEREPPPAGGDPEERIAELARRLQTMSPEVERLGRRIVALTVAAEQPAEGGPRRGYRRVEWIEEAIEPLRERLGPERFERLVTALASVIGFEAVLVQRDIRGLSAEEGGEASAWAARALIRNALEEAG